MIKLLLFLQFVTIISLYSSGLRVVYPNGGEMIAAGDSMNIVWDGVDAGDLIEIDYSTDNGESWWLITDKGKGLKYTWKNVPRLNGNKCLIRLREFKNKYSNSCILEHVLKCKASPHMVEWNPAGNRVATMSHNDSVRIWDINSGQLLYSLYLSNKIVRDAEWSPDGSRLAVSGHTDNGIRIWDEVNGIKVIKSDWSNKDLLSWSPDGKKIAILNSNGVQVLNAVDGQTIYSVIGKGITNSGDRRFLYWSSDGNRIVAFSQDTVNIFDALNGNIIKVIECGFTNWHWKWHINTNCNVNFISPDGQKLAIPNKDSIIQIIDVTDGSLLFGIHWFGDYDNSICWSPDSRQIIYNSILTKTQVWDAVNGVLIYTVPAIPFSHRMALSPEGLRLIGDNTVTAGEGYLQVWSIDNGLNLISVFAHKYEIFDFHWSPDGKRIATCAGDSCAKIWYLGNPLVQEDVSDSNWTIAIPKAVSKDIDMGKVLVDYTKDTIVDGYIINSGLVKYNIQNIFFEGTDKDMFFTNSGNQLIQIEPGNSRNVDFYFKPVSAGLKKAEVVIVTQCDTLRQAIRGEGVLPEIALLNNNIHFGEVKINKSRDSLVLLLHNKSPRQVRIDEMKLTGANPGEFEIANSNPFFIKSNEQKEILLRFKPSAIGLQTCNLECKFNGPGSPAITQLLGTGIFRPAEIQAGAVTFESLICKQNTESFVPITNNGMEGLIIKGAEITGTNLNDFEIVPPFSQMTIPPSETKDLNILFKPTGTGIRNANLVLTSNSYIDSILTIQLSSTKDSIALIPEVSKIDLGYLCPGEYKDTSLIISNEGTLQTGGYAIPTAGLSLENPEFTIDKANSVSIPFRFVGKPDEGIFNETITITDSVCGYSRIVEISGEIALPVIEISDVLFTARKGKTKDSQLSITNTGKRDLLMPNPPVITTPFTLIGNPFPLTVPAGESREITVRFSPVDTLEVFQDITFAAEPCGINTMFAVNGKGYEARARLRAGYAEGFAGDVVEIHVYLEESQNITIVGATKLKADLLFNPTVLSPQDRQITMIDNNTGSVSLENLPLSGIAGEEIARVKFTAALGNAEYNPIYFSNIESDAGEIEFDTVSGCFRLLGICRDGGDRLINSTGGVILSILPNPAGETLEIELGLWESGRTRLYLSDITGNEVKQLFDGNVTTYGKRKLTANINELADGVYFVILQTPSGRQSAMLVKN